MSGGKSSKVLALTFANGLNILVNFLTLPYLVRSLSFIEYGTYGQVLIIITFLSGFFTYNLNQVVSVYLSRKDLNQVLVFSTIMRVSFLAGLFSVILLLLLSPIFVNLFSNFELTKLLPFSVLMLVFQIPIPILLSILVYLGKVRQVTLCLIISNFVKVAFMLISIQVYSSLAVLVVGLGLAGLIQLIILLFIVPSNIRNFKLFNGDLARKVFRDATPLAISGVMEKLLIYLDGIMIAALLTTHEFALYRAGALEMPFISAIYGSVAAIVMPEVARFIANNDYQSVVNIKRRAIKSTSFLIYPIMIYLIVFSKPLIVFYLSEDYTLSAGVFTIFTLTLLIRINDYQDVLILKGKSKYILFASTCMVFINLILNYSLIKYFGIYGGSMAYVLALFGFAGVLSFLGIRMMHTSFIKLFDPVNLIKILILSLMICLPVYLIFKYFIDSIWVIIAGAPFYFLLFIIAGSRLNLAEREHLNHTINRIPLLNKLLI